MKRVITTIFALALHGCATVGPHLGRAEDVVVSERGVDENNGDTQICEGFDLNKSEAKKFLDKARIVTPYEIHDSYNTLPCYVRGSASFGGKPASWEIRAGGTGEVTFWSEFTFLVVDEAQRDRPE